MRAAHPLAGEAYHLFGVGGRGMAPLALAARHLGAEVSGCDTGARPETRTVLAEAGFPVEDRHSVDHVRAGTTFVATSVARTDEPEMLAAAATGGVVHRTDLLARVLAARTGVGVTGSHGKGTVTALAAGCLEAAGLDPLVVVGVTVPDLGGMMRPGTGPVVAEVDDSDLSLSRVATDVAVVTNLDDDHPFLPTTLAQSVEGVGGFVAKARGTVVLGPSPRAERLATFATADVWRYGRDFTARTLSADRGVTRVVLHAPDGSRTRAVVRLLGPATAVNAALAHAAALAAGADAAAAAAGLERVGSIRRRLEPLGERDGVLVVDDYGAKHPACLRAGILALRRHYRGGRLVAVVEHFAPYLAPWGRRFAAALSLADEVVVAPARQAADFPDARAATPGAGEGWADRCTVPVTRTASRAEAASEAIGRCSPGDVLVCFTVVGDGREIALLALGRPGGLR